MDQKKPQESPPPPAPPSRISMIGSAFSAVKSYFTPEKPTRSLEKLGITPLAREFAALTIDDSTQDSTTDSYMTPLSRMDESFESTTSQAEKLEDSVATRTEDLPESRNQTIVIEETLLESPSSSSPDQHPKPAPPSLSTNPSESLDESVIILHDDAEFAQNRSQIGFETYIKTEKPESTPNRAILLENTSQVDATNSFQAPDESSIVLSDGEYEDAATPQHGEKRSQIGFESTESPKKIKLSHDSSSLRDGSTGSGLVTGTVDHRAVVSSPVVQSNESLTLAQNFAKQIEDVINASDCAVSCSAFEHSELSTSLDALKPGSDTATKLPAVGVGVDLENELVFEMVTPDVGKLNEITDFQVTLLTSKIVADDLSETVATPVVCQENVSVTVTASTSVSCEERADKENASVPDSALSQKEAGETSIEISVEIEDTPVLVLSAENEAEQPDDECIQSVMTPPSTTSQGNVIQKPTVEKNIQITECMPSVLQKEMSGSDFGETTTTELVSTASSNEASDGPVEVPVVAVTDEGSTSEATPLTNEFESYPNYPKELACTAADIAIQKETTEKYHSETATVHSSTTQGKEASEVSSSIISQKEGTTDEIKTFVDNTPSMSQDETSGLGDIAFTTEIVIQKEIVETNQESTSSTVLAGELVEKSVRDIARIADSKSSRAQGETIENPTEVPNQVMLCPSMSEKEVAEHVGKAEKTAGNALSDTLPAVSQKEISVCPGEETTPSEVNLFPTETSTWEESNSATLKNEMTGTFFQESTLEVVTLSSGETAEPSVDRFNVISPEQVSKKPHGGSASEEVVHLPSGGPPEVTSCSIELTVKSDETSFEGIEEMGCVEEKRSGESVVAALANSSQEAGSSQFPVTTMKHDGMSLHETLHAVSQEKLVGKTLDETTESPVASLLDSLQGVETSFEECSEFAATAQEDKPLQEVSRTPSALSREQLIENSSDKTTELDVAASTIPQEDAVETLLEEMVLENTRVQDESVESFIETTQAPFTSPSDVLQVGENGKSMEDISQYKSPLLVAEYGEGYIIAAQSQKEVFDVPSCEVLKKAKSRRSRAFEKKKLVREQADQLPDAPAHTLPRWEELLGSELEEEMEIFENEDAERGDSLDSYQPLSVMINALTPIQEVMEISSDSGSSVSPNPAVTKELLAADRATQRMLKGYNLNNTASLDIAGKGPVGEFLPPAPVSKIMDSCSQEDDFSSHPLQDNESGVVNTSLNPASGLIEKWLVESTPLAAFRKQIANMSDVSPISTATPEALAAHSTPTESYYIDSPLLDQGMLQSSPEAQLAVTGVNITQALTEVCEAVNMGENEQQGNPCLEKNLLNASKALLLETTNIRTLSSKTELQSDTDTNENYTECAVSALNATKVIIGDDASNPATKVLDGNATSINVANIDAGLENFLLHAPMNSTITLVRSKSMTPENSLNRTHTLETAAESVASSAMNITKTLAGRGVSSSPVMVVSPICSQVTTVPQTGNQTITLSSTLGCDNQETHQDNENWNGTAASDLNKNKKTTIGVLKEISVNIQEDNMGVLFSAKEEPPLKPVTMEHFDTNESFGNFDLLNMNPPSTTGVINRESLYMRFDPLYQPPSNCSSDKTIFVDNLNTLVCLNNLSGGNLEDITDFSSPKEDPQEKLKNEIARLYALHDENQQKAQLKEADFKRMCADIERQCSEAREALEQSESRQQVLQHRLVDLSSDNQALAAISREFERTVEAARSNLKARKKSELPSPDTLAAERDSYQHHLKSAEAAFVDVLTKYEKLRASLLELQSGVSQQEREAAELRRELTRQDERIRASESAAAAELEQLRRETSAEGEQFSTDAARVTAKLRKSELSLKTLQDSLDKTVVENEKLAALCDDIIAGRS